MKIYDKPYLLLVAVTLSWGANAVAGRIAVDDISPMTLVFFRWVGVAILLLLFARKPFLREWSVIRGRLGYILLLGATGFTGFNALFYAAAHNTTAINIGILQGSIPIIVLLGAYLIYRMEIRPWQLLGVLVTLGGVTVVAAQGELARLQRLEFNFGDLLMIGACLLYAGYTLALRSRPNISGMAMFTVMAFSALVTSVPLFIWEYANGDFFWPTSTGWMVVIFVILFPSFLSQIFFLRAVDLIGPARAGVFVNLVPVFAAALSVLVLGETFQLFHGVSLLLVFLGIALAETRRAKG